MEVNDIIKLVSNNGLAIVLLIWVLYKADKYLQAFVPKFDDIIEAINHQTIAFTRLSNEIELLNQNHKDNK